MISFQNKISYLMLMVIIYSLNCGANNPMCRKPKNIEVKLKIINGIEISKLFEDSKSDMLSNQIYIYGKISNTDSNYSVSIVLDVWCNEYSFLKAKDIQIEWIPPNNYYSIYFIQYLGTLHLKDDFDINNLTVDYKIKNIKKK